MASLTIIGAGQAAISIASKLRLLGFKDPITMIGEEPVPPYERPPLSKSYLLGEHTIEQLYLRGLSYYDEQGITLCTDCRVQAIDRSNRRLETDGGSLPYEELALTTGATPISLPHDISRSLQGVHVVRTIADVDALAESSRAAKRALVIGGGYIGLEGAAVLRKLGLDVTLIELAPRILARVAAPATSDYFRALHQRHGLDLREGVGLTSLEGEARVAEAHLTDGSRLAVDLVVVGIGVRPDTALASAAGLAIDNGIAVNERGQTSDPSVWSAGDCASFPWRGRRIRLESVQNAVDQANVVAENIVGRNVAYAPTPWFWSDQFDVKLQIAGLNTGYDTVVARKGRTAGSVSHWYYADRTLLAVDALNDARSFMAARRMIENGRSPSIDDVANSELDLKTLL